MLRPVGFLDRLLGRTRLAPSGLPPEPGSRAARQLHSLHERERRDGLRAHSPEHYGARKVRRHGVTLKVEFRDFEGLATMDLRGLPAAEFGIQGYSFHVEYAGPFKAKEYRLVREPDNPADSDAIAVFNVERKVGYLSRSKAAQYAPALDALPVKTFLVGGVVRDEGKLLVLLPKLPDLRRLVREHSGPSS